MLNRPWHAAAVVVIAAGAGCAMPAAPTATTPLTVEAEAAQWKPMVVDAAALKPAAPGAFTEAELKELREWQARRTEEDLKAIQYWNVGAASLRWSEVTREMVVSHGDVPPKAARALGAAHAAMYDAVLVSWAAKHEHKRAAPAAADLTPVVAAPGVPGYPSEHAAVAAATALTLAYLYPDKADELTQRAKLAAETRLAAGANVRSDIDAGWGIGEAVAKQVIARLEHDGSVTEAPVAIQSGPDRWSHVAPMEPKAGSWKPWLLTTGSQFRLAEPPRPGSEDFAAGLAEVLAVKETLTDAQRERANYWNYDVPAVMWNDRARTLLAEKKAGTPKTARTLAWLHAVTADAFIACWDSKYAILQPRPEHAATDWKPFVATPPHPSYPSGHATCSMAAAVYLGTVFPEAKDSLVKEAEEAAMSRLWGGIHYRRDNDDGLVMGRQIAEYALEKARADGTP